MYEDLTERKRLEREQEIKDLEIQYSSVISMISSIFIHNSDKVDDNIIDGLRTLCGSLNCSFIGIFHHLSTQPPIELELKWKFQVSNSEVDFTSIINFWKEPPFIDYCSNLPPEIFSRIQLGIKSNHSSKNKKTQLSGSIILVPILVGSDRYGSMLIFDSNKNREYSAREIQLSLSVAIIIGLALKNQINRDLFLYTFNALSQFNFGAFILTNDDQNAPKMLFLNDKMRDLIGIQDLVADKVVYSDYFDPSEAQYVNAIYRARLQGTQLPNAYILNLLTIQGIRPVLMMNFTSKMDERFVTIGFFVDWELQNFKTAKEIYEEYLLHNKEQCN